MKCITIPAALAGMLVLPAVTLAANSPFGIATPDSPAGNGVTGPAAPLLLAAMRLQTLFYQKLIGALDAFSADPYAGLWLIGLSFLYGIFHAVGPGHGKAVISSYVLATGERLRQATFIAIVASLLQALSAVAIVLIATKILDSTAAEITAVTDNLELGSYALIVLMGVTLLASKGRRLVSEWRQERGPPSRFLCEGFDGAVSLAPHRHDADCGCLAVSHLVTGSPKASLKERLQAVVSIGIRPCSGALIVLVFALTRNLALAGILSVFAMAAGTALTVSLVAVLSVLARSSLARLSLSTGGVKPYVGTGLEFAVAAVVSLFGMTMLIGSLAMDGLL